MGDPLILNGKRLPIKYEEFSEKIINPFYDLKMSQYPVEEQLIRIFDNNLSFAVYNLFKWKGEPLKLAPFQAVILQMLWEKTFPMMLLSRGGSKTFMLGLYALTRAIMVPGTKVVIVAASFRQSKLVFDYARQIYNYSPIVQQCVTKLSPNNDMHIMEINHGMSTIIALPLGDGERIRGIRACVAADTLIQTDSGLVQMRDIVESRHDFKIWNGLDFEAPRSYVRTPITNVHKVTTVGGYSIEFSDIHRLWTTDGWKDIDTLSIGDRLTLNYSTYFPEEYFKIPDIEINNEKTRYNKPLVVDENLGSILGYLVSEGYVKDRSVFTFVNTDLTLVNDFCNKIEKVFGIKPSVYQKSGYTDKRGWKCKPSYCAMICSIGIRRILAVIGLDRDGALNKFIPHCILQSPRSVVKSFLSALFEGDGTAYIGKPRGNSKVIDFAIAYYTASSRLCKEIQTLLLKFGLISFTGTRICNLSTNEQWTLRMTRGMASAFSEEIGFISQNKIDKCNIGMHLYPAKSFHRPDLKIKKIDRNIRQDILYDVCMPSQAFIGNGFKNHNTDILVDEISSVPEEVLNVVVRGFASVSADPIRSAEALHAEDTLVKRGQLDPKSIKRRLGNKIILSGTAHYQFNHSFKTYKLYRAILENKFIGDAKKLQADVEQEEESMLVDYRDYALLQIPYTAIPKGFMDEKQIAQAKASMPKAQFQMEYECQFPTDSDGFFKRSAINEATPGISKTCSLAPFNIELSGEAGFSYVMGIDPARKSDNFAISIIKLLPDGKFKNVYCWAFNNKSFIDCVRKIRDLLRKFNIVRIAMDAGGGGNAIMDLLQSAENAGPQDLPIWQFDDKDQMMLNGLHILDMVNFVPTWIANANYGMAADIEHQRLLFPSRGHNNVLGDEQEEVWDNIAEQINETCMIVITPTKTGVQHFDLPETNIPGVQNTQRKDRYSALLLSTYAARSYLTEQTISNIDIAIGDWIEAIP